MKYKRLFILFGLALGIMCLFFACRKKENPPPNPYDSITRATGTTPDTLDPNSFVWIHRNVLSPRCASPGCHDGSFEPDYRTVQSSYATLVYHPVVKKLSPWKYRVKPYDTANSWLWQRLNHELIVSGADTSQGRMPLYSSKLNDTEMGRIRNWIMSGAKDAFGSIPKLPNNEPTITGFIALDSVYAKRFDTSRIGNVFYNSFYAPANSTMNIAIGVTDDSTAVNQLKVNQLKISTKKDDFSTAWTYTGSYIKAGNNEFYLIPIKTNIFPKQTILYMRYYVNDGSHVQNTEMPRTDMVDPYKTMWSFYIK